MGKMACFFPRWLVLCLTKILVDGLLTEHHETSFTEKYKVLIPELLKDPVFANLSRAEYDYSHFNRSYGGEPFPCQQTNCSSTANSVHRLRPCDISLVASLGDSITAAFAAKSLSLITLFVEYRGISWSIGERGSLATSITLPNILKKYNSKVKGGAAKATLPKIPIPWREHLDVAVSGAISLDLPGQAKTLIKRMKFSYKEEFENGWKILTIFIGGNDLCGLCENSKHTVEKYVSGIRDSLDLLHNEVPKMFVNLVQILDVTRLNDLDSPYCRALHSIVCSCGTTEGKEWQRKVSMQTLKYQQAVRDLINSGRYDTRDDFTVVIQPFLEGTTIPRLPNGKADRSYFAPDCFHFSSKAHASAALALWNNMVEPVGRKRKMWSVKEKYECPPKDFPYFFTIKNSKEYLESPPHQRSVGSPQEPRDAQEANQLKETSLTTVTLCISFGALFVMLVGYTINKRLKTRQYKLLVDDESLSYGAMK